MKDLIQHTWTENCKVGAYLVSITPSAYAHLNEQLRKYQVPSTLTKDALHPMFAQATGSGIYRPIFHKLACLHKTIQQKLNDEQKANKEYVYALRNMLLHSDYKTVVKYLEKQSTMPASLADFEAELPKILAINGALDLFTQLKYRLLYSFIKTIVMTSRCETKLQQQGNMYEHGEIFFEHLQENNTIVALLTHVYEAKQQDVTADEQTTILNYYVQLQKDQPQQQAIEALIAQIDEQKQTVSATDLLSLLDVYAEELNLPYYLKEPYRAIEQALLAQQLELPHLLQSIELTLMDLQQLMYVSNVKKPKKRVKILVEALVQHALIWHMQQLAEQVTGQTISPQKPIAQKPVQPIAEPNKKELQETKNQLRLMTVEAKSAKDALEKANEQLLQLTKQLQQQQQQIDKLEQALENEKQKPPTVQQVVPQEAQQLTLAMASLLEEMKMALDMEQEEVVDEAVEEIEPTIIEQLAHLKIGIIGGHSKYHSRLKTIFPQPLLTMTPDKLNGSLSKLLQCDVVVIITSYNNHSLYERCFDYMKRQNAKERCLILNSQPNAKRLALEIGKFVGVCV